MSNSILDFFERVLKFFETEAPIASAIMAAIPGLQVPAAGAVLLSQVPAFCKAAEAILGPSSGALKKDMVQTMAGAAIGALKKAYPAEATKYEGLATAIPLAIEQTVANVKMAQAVVQK